MTSQSLALARRAPSGPLLLAYSGGLDSTVLLHLLVEAGLGQRLRVVHVNHQLHPDSDQWAEHCQRQARSLGLRCHCERVQVDHRNGMEAGAREARYAVLAQYARGATIITAHHRDDQAETLMLRLLRGAGVHGLAAMREFSRREGLSFWRPLLSVGRGELETMAEARGLGWLHDPSNEELEPDRNYLRQLVMPALEKRWSGTAKRLHRAASHLDEAAQLLDERARDDVTAMAGKAGFLPVPGLRALSAPRRRNVLRWWLVDSGAAAPSTAILHQIERQLEAPADRQASVTWGHWQLRRYRDWLYLLTQEQLQPMSARHEWQPSDGALVLGAWRLEPGEGGVDVFLPADQGPFSLRPFEGGERLLRNGMHQQVSELWRAAGVPPWRRRQWPLFYLRDELVSVPLIGVADHFTGVEQTRWHLAVHHPHS